MIFDNTQVEKLDYELAGEVDNPDAAVIWLHGLGADGFDFVPVVPELQLPSNLRIKFIFPHAPIRPVTLNNGYQMRAWYDLLSLEGEKTAREDDILATVTWVTALIRTQIECGINASRIVLAGFSQGGVIAIHTALRSCEQLAGVMMLSTYMPFAESVLAANTQHPGLPVFAAHGQQDPVIPVKAWEHYVPLLNDAGFDVSSKVYAMPHSVCAEEIREISNWLQLVLSR